MKTPQKNLDGEQVTPQVEAKVWPKPSLKLMTTHFILKSNAKVIASTRKKDDAQSKFWSKIKPRKDAKSIPDGAYEEEGTELVSAAMHMDLPDFEQDWVKVKV